MNHWSGPMLLAVASLIACRNADGTAPASSALAPESPTARPDPSVDPHPVRPSPPRSPKVEADPARSEAATTPSNAGPATPDTPSPSPDTEPPLGDPDDEAVRIAGRSVAARILEVEPDAAALAADEDALPTLTLVVSVEGGTTDERLSLPTGLEVCENNEAIVEPIKGSPSPLALAQAFCEDGEDEFSRRLFAAVIHVGDVHTAARVLWQGKGHYENSFGVCEHMDVPEVAVIRPGVVRIKRRIAVLEHSDPDRLRPRCRPRKPRVTTTAELSF